jgi:hypothetical protein
MIDTLVFQVPMDERIRLKILTTGKKSTQYDFDQARTIYGITNGKLETGSWHTQIRWTVSDKTKFIKIEFSLPKQLLGNNIQMLHADDIQPYCKAVYRRLKNEFGYFPALEYWNLHRLDTCYNFRTPSNEHAHALVEFLKILKYPQKTEMHFETSAFWKGATFSLKFYEKYPEFMKHDYKKLMEQAKEYDLQEKYIILPIEKEEIDQARRESLEATDGSFQYDEEAQAILIKNPHQREVKDLMEASKGIVRFECTFRHQYLIDYFQKNVLDSKLTKFYNRNTPRSYSKPDTFIGIEDINSKVVFGLLNKHFNELFRYIEKTTMTRQQVKSALTETYGNQKAGSLYLFYLAYYSKNATDRQVIKKAYNRTTIWRNLKALKNANVGAPDTLLTINTHTWIYKGDNLLDYLKIPNETSEKMYVRAIKAVEYL